MNSAIRIERALLVYPSQIFCADPETAPIVLKTQMVKLYSFLRNRGISVDVLDLELEFGRPRNEEECRIFLERTESKMQNAIYDFVGVSCYTSLSYLSTLAICSLAGRIQPQAIVAVGGYHCLGNVNDFREFDDIDFIVRGCGLQFLEALLEGPVPSRICNFTGSAPLPKPMRYTEYPYRYERNPAIANVQLSQGCPFQCEFCCEPYTKNTEYRSLEIEDALQSLDQLIQEIEPAKVVIEDVLFGFKAGWRYAFLESLLARQYSQVFWVEMRVDIITEKTVALLSKMNFDVTIGLESLSIETLRNMNKTKHPDRYIDAFFKTAEMFQRYDVPVTYTIMLNYPGETWESFLETFRNIEKAQKLVEAPVFDFDFLEYMFYPGNHTFEKIDALQATFGTEIGDRDWYKRTDGCMLEKSLCTVPSHDLLRRFGRDGMRSYFRREVERVQSRVTSEDRPRSALIRSWRFVEALKKRVPEWQRIDFFQADAEPEIRSLGSAVARLIPVHRQLTLQFQKELTGGNDLSWWDCDQAWNLAVEYISNEIRQVGPDQWARIASPGEKLFDGDRSHRGALTSAI